MKDLKLTKVLINLEANTMDIWILIVRNLNYVYTKIILELMDMSNNNNRLKTFENE